MALAIVDLGVFMYLPQYSTWAVVGSAVLLSLYHPWWRPRIDKSKHDRIFMNGQWRMVKKDSWRPVWVCESCNKAAIDQIETGQMLPCRNCRHENETFGPNLWYGEGPDGLYVIGNTNAMQQRESGSKTQKTQPRAIDVLTSSSTSITQRSLRPSGALARTSSTRFCRECGAKIPRDSRYCEECGTSLA
jgi:hypothetical protein